MASRSFRAAAAILAVGSVASAGTPYSIDSNAAILTSSSTLAYDVMTYYSGNLSGQTPGILPGPPPAGPYYWWEAGALWGTMIDYWHLTGDTTYNDVTTQAMLFQVGPNLAFMPPNVTVSLGNDDQGFWGMSAMLAAEVNFPNPPADQPQWLTLAQAVFNTQASPDRHDDTCGGGLRWQIPASNTGYDYKNSIANGIFFNMGARLARYTNNQSYYDWAIKTWDWEIGVNFMDADYNIYDGGHVEHNCTDINKAQFSYNAAVWLLGSAYMYNYTNGSTLWQTRLDGLIDTTFKVFFPNNTAYELSCETGGTCQTDMYTFKGFLHRWLATTTQIAPYTHAKIMPILKDSAQAAINQCTGGTTGRQCGFKWTTGVFDGNTGAGQQMSVLAAVSSLLIDQAHVPVTNSTGGTSVGDYSAGIEDDSIFTFGPITNTDRAGAGILTFLILVSALGTFGWMSIGA